MKEKRARPPAQAEEGRKTHPDGVSMAARGRNTAGRPATVNTHTLHSQRTVGACCARATESGFAQVGCDAELEGVLGMVRKSIHCNGPGAARRVCQAMLLSKRPIPEGAPRRHSLSALNANARKCSPAGRVCGQSPSLINCRLAGLFQSTSEHVKTSPSPRAMPTIVQSKVM